MITTTSSMLSSLSVNVGGNEGNGGGARGAGGAEEVFSIKPTTTLYLPSSGMLLSTSSGSRYMLGSMS
eukprot:CAMPEP_0114272832 /NCGR_PEP_ID=MMETSP0058-20121206/28716_1 /TAXON_ID=36894 /ORGANISM="Pyramimonas parkeae, CCMP726" /LENGTH=67 /DNA_ID=CAMNT_0001392131 /DNA_START=358 /DNA_END=557 /DNA_ORIENTATION=-